MPNPENLIGKGFLPGESGNPNGRPIGSKNRSTIARKWLELELSAKNPLTGEMEKLSQEDILTLTQIKKAQVESDTNAYKAVMDSAYGAPKNEVEHSGQVGVIWNEVKTYDSDEKTD